MTTGTIRWSLLRNTLNEKFKNSSRYKFMITWLSQSINLSQASLNKKSPFIHSTSLSSFRLIVQVPLTDFHFTYIKVIYYNVWLNKLTLSRGLLLLLSFAEHKVISSKSSTHNTVASGIFTKVCMMRKPVKTGVRSKLWPNIFKKASVSMIC